MHTAKAPTNRFTNAFVTKNSLVLVAISSWRLLSVSVPWILIKDSFSYHYCRRKHHWAQLDYAIRQAGCVHTSTAAFLSGLTGRRRILPYYLALARRSTILAVGICPSCCAPTCSSYLAVWSYWRHWQVLGTFCDDVSAEKMAMREQERVLQYEEMELVWKHDEKLKWEHYSGHHIDKRARERPRNA